MKFNFVIIITIIFISVIEVIKANELSEAGFFSGRIAKMNGESGVVRIKVNFENVKYINQKDIIEFWDEKNEVLKCRATIHARNSDYLLIKVSNFIECKEKLPFQVGAYLKFFSEDLYNNITMGKEVMGILLKKRQSISGMMEEKNKFILGFEAKKKELNVRFQKLKEELDLQKAKEEKKLEEERALAIKFYKEFEVTRDDIDQKIELYRLKDENMILDRWSLDPQLYYRK